MVQDGYEGDSLMALTNDEAINPCDLVKKLDKDRAWLLEEIDKGSWPELRLELAALEREMGQVLIRAKEKLED